MSDRSSVEKTTEDREAQTVIKVYPFLLSKEISSASATSDKKFCTVLSLEASKDSKQFFNLLKYCPFYEIQENNIKILELPRKTTIQFIGQTGSLERSLRYLSLEDDDGVAAICADLILRLRTGKKQSFAEAETQTDIMVRPYLLEEPKIARIYLNASVQATSKTCGANSAPPSGGAKKL